MSISLHLATEIQSEIATRSAAPSRAASWSVRLFDVLVSLVMLIVLLPLLLVLALLIVADSAGSPLYRQERLGLGGRPFVLLKFRSMRADAEAVGPRWTSDDDPRITRIGRPLRRTGLDELPQLWNVLQGDMSLVGPRPERRLFTDQLSAYIPNFRSRLLVKPGITGWAQINMPECHSIEDARIALGYDLDYVRNWSFATNLRILLRAVGIRLPPARS